MGKKTTGEKMVVYDLIFGILLVAISAFFAIESAVMTRPRTWLTAPGMPPLIIFISLGCMGLGLLVSAVKARGLELLAQRWQRSERKVSWKALLQNRTIMLNALFFLYFLVFTQVLPFELATFVYLALTFKIFWKRSLLMTLLAAFVITLSFSLVFSEFFKVMLPGIAWRDFLQI